MPFSRLSRAAGAIAALWLAFPAAADDPAALVEALRGGGHVVFIRHAATEADYADQTSAVMGDCATQRMLSEDGWRQAKAIGDGFERLGIPVGDVISSEYCRAWQTADLAFGRYEKTPDLNFAPAEDYTETQIAEMRDRVSPLLARAPEPGSNVVLVGHDDPFEAATGIYPEPQGVAFVLRPDSAGGFQVLGSIAPDALTALAE